MKTRSFILHIDSSLESHGLSKLVFLKYTILTTNSEKYLAINKRKNKSGMNADTIGKYTQLYSLSSTDNWLLIQLWVIIPLLSLFWAFVSKHEFCFLADSN